MLFDIQDNTLTPANATAKRYVEARSGQVDLVPMSQTKRRSLDQNRLFHAWCGELSAAMPEQFPNAVEVHRYVKLKQGLKILYENDIERWEDARQMLMALPHEKRLEASDCFHCTRLMNVSQMQRLLDWMQQHFAEQGIILET